MVKYSAVFLLILMFIFAGCSGNKNEPTGNSSNNNNSNLGYYYSFKFKGKTYTGTADTAKKIIIDYGWGKTPTEDGRMTILQVTRFVRYNPHYFDTTIFAIHLSKTVKKNYDSLDVISLFYDKSYVYKDYSRPGATIMFLDENNDEWYTSLYPGSPDSVSYFRIDDVSRRPFENKYDGRFDILFSFKCVIRNFQGKSDTLEGVCRSKIGFYNTD